jgi:ankyrin repeat protein
MGRLSLFRPHFLLSISPLFGLASMMLVALWLSSAAFAAGGASANKKKDLLKAVRKGDAEKAVSLVSDVSPGDAIDALAQAAKSGYVNVVQALVAKGVDVNGGLSPSSGPSVVSGDSSDDAIMASLMPPFCIVGAALPNTPLFAAIGAGKLDVVTWLVEHKASLEIQGDACLFQDLKQENGRTEFRVMRETHAGNTAASEAVLDGQLTIFQYLVEHGADLSRRLIYQSAAIPGLEGIQFGRWSQLSLVTVDPPSMSIRQLRRDELTWKADRVSTSLPIQMQKESTISDLAMRSTDEIKEFMVKLLLDYKADPNATSKLGETPLHLAIVADRVDAVELLLSNGADVNAKENHGVTPLHLAAAYGWKSVVEVLLAHNADVNAREDDGETPLRLAEGHQYYDVIALLRQHGGHD